jgi:DedD protein
MDHELKQRLIGAIVVTAMAAIFIPMLFDDPVDTSGQQVSELQLPKAPNDIEKLSDKQLPEDLGRALVPTDAETTDLANATTEKDNLSTAELPDQTATSAPIAEEELSAVESDSEDNSATKPKAPVETLDTGDITEAESPVDKEPPPVRIHPKVSNVVPEPKIKKKPKPVEPESHKTATKPVTDVEAESAHKTKTTTKTDTGMGRWSIQAGSFSKKENAEALLAKLQKQGFPVTLQSKGSIYRLKIGPELDKQRATDMKKKLDKQNIQSLMIAE